MVNKDSILSEIANIDSQLKKWFLFRRVQAERSLSIKKLLEDNNFIGLSNNNENLPLTDRILWHDIVKGRPELEDELSLNAREMKVCLVGNHISYPTIKLIITLDVPPEVQSTSVPTRRGGILHLLPLPAPIDRFQADMYMDIFRRSCDYDNECRLSGSQYFQCLQNNFKLNTDVRVDKCNESFIKFDKCRQKLKDVQNLRIEEAIRRQDEQDSRAKELFDRRLLLMEKL